MQIDGFKVPVFVTFMLVHRGMHMHHTTVHVLAIRGGGAAGAGQRGRQGIRLWLHITGTTRARKVLERLGVRELRSQRTV